MANGTVKVSQVDVLTTSGTGTISIVPPATNTNRTLTLPDQTATVATLTTPSFGTTIGVGGATASSSGAGVTFPATQSASTDANTLDDYEEGTWTITLTPASGSITLNTSFDLGAYTKIGRQVTCTGNFVISSVSSPTGSITLGGLPFSVASLSENSERFAGIVNISAFTSGNGCGNVVVDSGTSGSIKSSTNTAPVAVASGELYVCITYFTD